MRLFGNGVSEIKDCFLSLDSEALSELLADYGDMHGASAEAYAKNTYPNWKSGKTGLSGQTMERLATLVPPYLSPEQRFKILQLVLGNGPKLAKFVGRSNVLRKIAKAHIGGIVFLIKRHWKPLKFNHND